MTQGAGPTSDVFEAFLHNWTSGVSMDTEWQDVIEASADAMVEERAGYASRPRRTITVRWDAVTRAELHRLFFLMARQQGQDYLFVPLYQDVSVTTSSSSGTTINCPTTTRRFYAGQTVFIFSIVGGRPSNVQRATIDTVGGSSLTLTGALTGSYAAGAVVLPTILVHPTIRAGANAMCEGVGSFEQTFFEQANDDASLPALADYADIAGDREAFTAADGEDYYLLHVGPNWASQVNLTAERSGNEIALGQDRVIAPRGPRARYGFKFSALAADRDEVWDLLKFWDAHRGRLVPFFVANPLTIWTVTNLATGWVEVTRSGDIDDPAGFASYLFLETTDGTHYVRQITGTTDSSGDNRLAVSPVLPVLTANQIRRATTAHLVRFASSALREEWASSSVAQVAFDLVEVLGEVVSVEGLP